MGVGDQRDPVLAGHQVVALLAVAVEAFAAAAVGERAGVAGVVQGAQHPPVLQRHPGQLALVGPGATRTGNSSPSAVNCWIDFLQFFGPRPYVRRRARRICVSGIAECTW